MMKPTPPHCHVTGIAGLLVLCLLPRPVQAHDFFPVTDAMLQDPDPSDWSMIHRTYDFHSFSPLDQINRDNVGSLRVAWMRAMDEGHQEIRPLVYDGVMFIAHPSGDHIQALVRHFASGGVTLNADSGT